MEDVVAENETDFPNVPSSLGMKPKRITLVTILD
jgi:hypothetical protein